MPQDSMFTAVAHAIQLAVAPVFLLTAIGALLGVLTSRLGRIVDRARRVEERLPALAGDAVRWNAELDVLARRARLVNQAISLCTVTALLIAALIALLFLGASMRFNSPVLVAALFITAMLALIAGLIAFLREIFVATASVRIGRHAQTPGPSPSPAGDPAAVPSTRAPAAVPPAREESKPAQEPKR